MGGRGRGTRGGKEACRGIWPVVKRKRHDAGNSGSRAEKRPSAKAAQRANITRWKNDRRRWCHEGGRAQGEPPALLPSPGTASPSKPARSRRFSGYQSRGRLPTGSSGFGMLEVRSVMREPPPAAITTAWNSICHRETASLTHGSTGPGRAEPSGSNTGSLQPGPTVPLPAVR